MTCRNNAIAYALDLIKCRYGDVYSDGWLAYHNVSHTEGVVLRTIRIAHALRLSERDTTFAVIGAAFHDSVQQYKLVWRDDGAVLRQRFVRLNEIDSAREAIRWMLEKSGVAFAPEEYDLVFDSVLVTIPSWSSEFGTVVQHRLKPDSHAVVRAVALADIGAPGMDTDAFLRDTQTLFLEEHVDVATVSVRGGYETDADMRTRQLERYRGWLKNQVGFARGRHALFEGELGNLDGAIKKHITTLFPCFDESIRRSRRVYEESLSLDYDGMIETLRSVVGE